MSNIEVTIKIDINHTDSEISPADTIEKADDGFFRLVLDGKSSLDIDTLEDGLLRMSYPALRETLARHLENESKKKAISESHRLQGVGYQVVRHSSNYCVDGEIGRFEFGLFDVQLPDNRVVFEGTSLFPARKGKQRYQTCGFKEIALLSGVVQRSYRQTTKVFNRCRRQVKDGTRWNTLRDNARACGSKVINFLEKKTERILKDNGFTTDGLPETHCQAVTQATNNSPAQIDGNIVTEAREAVCKEMQELGIAKKLVEEVNKKASKKVYEKHNNTVHIHIDDVGVKKQKEHRCNFNPKCSEPSSQKKDKNRSKVQNTVTRTPCSEPSSQKKNKKRPTVQNTVARIEHNTKNFTLTGSSLFQV